MNDAEVAIATAAAGASVVVSQFSTRLQRLDKGGGDFATNADIEAERKMLALLRTERPDDAVLGEEMGRTGAATRTWLIDPLCGTLNYAARMRVVAVNVALVMNGKALVAAVADPFADEIFWTDGHSAHVRDGGVDASVSPSASSTLVDLNLDPPFPNAPTFRATSLAGAEGFMRRFRPRVVSSSIALAWVAVGRRAGYVTDGDVSNSVHFAAGLSICEAAGCVITDLKGNPWGNGPTGLIAAADDDTHSALLQLVLSGFRS